MFLRISERFYKFAGLLNVRNLNKGLGLQLLFDSSILNKEELDPVLERLIDHCEQMGHKSFIDSSYPKADF